MELSLESMQLSCLTMQIDLAKHALKGASVQPRSWPV